MQGDFVLDLAKELKKNNIHVALETSGFCDFAFFEAVLNYVDLFLYDYKETDPELHKKYTGVSNELILDNLHKLYVLGAKIFLRCPIIPGLNDREDHFQGIAGISLKYPALEGLELLPYHNLGASKAGRMGLETRQVFSKASRETVEEWERKILSLTIKKP